MKSQRLAVAAMLAAIASGCLPAVAANAHPGPPGADWPSAGQNAHNTRNAPDERILNAGNVSRLAPKWTLTTEGDVVATPVVSHGVVYAPDQGGGLWAVDANSGRVIWSTQIGDYTGGAGDAARSSPAIDGDTLVIGTGAGSATVGAYLLGIDTRTGRLRWKTQVDDHAYARITSSPVIDNGSVYVGVSSAEELAPVTYSFRGSVVALDVRTGRLRWQRYMVPQGYAGGAVWGSTPVVDHRTGLVYVGTGNNYTVPDGVCAAPGETGCTPLPSDDYIDAIVGINLRTGKVAWSHLTLTADVWNGTAPEGPDYDIGSGPNLFTANIHGRQHDLIGIGQKSGLYWALDATNGDLVWKTQVGAGGQVGGIMWGAATDGKRIYVAISDYFDVPYTIVSATGETSTITGGSWSALDPATGTPIWQVPDPQGAADIGFVSSANGVVYGGSAAPSGNTMYALNATDGTVLWGYPSGGSVVSGAAIVNGSVYWGSGDYIPGTTPDNKLIGFSLPRR